MVERSLGFVDVVDGRIVGDSAVSLPSFVLPYLTKRVLSGRSKDRRAALP